MFVISPMVTSSIGTSSMSVTGRRVRGSTISPQPTAAA
jgi:hypothetical protein